MKLPLASLIEDMDLYPRHEVDGVHVANLAAALESGCELPPILIDRDSKKIIDGWHRVRAARRVFGEESQIEVEVRSFPDRKSMVLEAIRLNSMHGRRLDGTDMIRAALMAQQAGANVQQVAIVLHITEARVRKLKLRVATVAPSSNQAAPRTTFVPLKRCVAAKFAGRRFTKSQADAHDTMPGTSFGLLAIQLTLAIEQEFIDVEDSGLMDALRNLSRALKSLLGEV